MTADIWFISDTHFCHTNIAEKFMIEGDRKARPFRTVEEMNETLIQRWNERVRYMDHVWHLGDVAMGNNVDVARVLRRLNGRKRMCVGNHDKLKGSVVMDFFEKVVLWRHFKDEGFLCTHVPIHPNHIRKALFNVHGHTHHHVLQDLHYVNICVEHTNYAPIHMDELKVILKEREKMLADNPRVSDGPPVV